MSRPRGIGLNVARRKRADGSIQEYFYERATGKLLGHDRAAAEAYLRGNLGMGSGAGGSLDALISDYLRTDAYKSKAPRTREIYRHHLDQLRERFGPMPVGLITPGWIERLKLDLQDKPRKANNTLAVLQIVLGLGVKLEYCKTNAAARCGRIEVQARTAIWTPEQIDTFVTAARPSLKLAIMLLLYTAQRPSDVLAMTKGHVSEREGRLYIALRQQKTAELLDVPVHSALAPLLRARLAEPAGGMLLVPSPTGRPWSLRNFSRAWDATLIKAGLARYEERARDGERTERVLIAELQRRDMRRTSVVLMAQAGMSTAQITAITGHRIESTAAILNTYLPRRTAVALAGVEAWEKAGPGSLSNVVTLAAKRDQRRGNKA